MSRSRLSSKLTTREIQWIMWIIFFTENDSINRGEFFESSLWKLVNGDL